MSDVDHTGTARSQLMRLATLTDVVYAVALVLVVTWLPLPEESHADGAVLLRELWGEYSANLIGVAIGLIFTIIYWLRSNTLMTALDRTDGVHTGLSIASVFFLLLLLYMVRVSAEVAAPSRRAGESVAVALIGITAGAAWWWARRKNLVRKGITKKEMLRVGDPALCLHRRSVLESIVARLYPHRQFSPPARGERAKIGMKRGHNVTPATALAGSARSRFLTGTAAV